MAPPTDDHHQRPDPPARWHRRNPASPFRHVDAAAARLRRRRRAPRRADGLQRHARATTPPYRHGLREEAGDVPDPRWAGHGRGRGVDYRTLRDFAAVLLRRRDAAAGGRPRAARLEREGHPGLVPARAVPAAAVRAGEAGPDRRPGRPRRRSSEADLDGRRLGALLARRRGCPMGLVLLQPDLGTTLVLGRHHPGHAARGRRPDAPPRRDRDRRRCSAPRSCCSSGMLKQLPEGPAHRLRRPGPGGSTARDAARRYNLDQSKIAIGAGRPRPARACSRAPRPGSATSPSSTPTSSSPRWARSSVSSARPPCSRCWASSCGGCGGRRSSPATTSAPCSAPGSWPCSCSRSFENVGMTMGIMPITGIPLPLVSLRRFVALITLFAGHGPGAERPHAPLRLVATRGLRRRRTRRSQASRCPVHFLAT